MTLLARLTSMVRWIVRRTTAEGELDDELRTYLDMAIAEKVREGLPLAEARRQAALELGGLDQVKERVRTRRHGACLDEIACDLRFAVRQLFRHPGFALAAIATLAVGIGATTAIFSTVNAAVLRPLPYPHPEDLYSLDTPATDGRMTTGLVSGLELSRLLTPNVSIQYAAGSVRVDATILRDDGTSMASVGYGVSDGFFDMFQMPAQAGRLFTHAEYMQGPAKTMVLSHHMWRDTYGSDPAIIGTRLRMANGPPVPAASLITVIGVAARDFDMPHGSDFWIPTGNIAGNTGHGFEGYVRVKPATRMERLDSEMASAMAGIEHKFGVIGKYRRYALTPLGESIVGDMRTMLVIVLAAAGLLLLVACVNVTNLLLARGAVRAREMAVRVALGAGRGRIIRQLLTESFVLSAVGTLVGLGFAFVGDRVLLAYGASKLPRLDRIPFDATVLTFALTTMVVTGLIVGFAPALRLARTSLTSVMSESGRTATGSGATRLVLKCMIVSEIALAITLVAGAGWLVRSFANLGASNAGFVADGRLMFDVLPPPDSLATWTQGLSERLRAIPGVTSVGTASTFPFGANREDPFYINVEGTVLDPDHPLVARLHRVDKDFFETMGIRLTAGRGFTADDRAETTRVAVVNKTFVRRYLGDRNPLATRFVANYPIARSPSPFTIVGVVDDVKYVSVTKAADPAYYVPDTQSPYSLQTFVLSTSFRDLTRIAASVREAVRSQDRQLPVEPRTVSGIVAQSLIRQRLGMTLMTLFAFAALLLAAVGIYGVISYVSSQRAREIATRMALGATPSHVFWMMMKQARGLAVIGTVAGVVLAYAAGRAGSSLLYEVRASDPVILVMATALVVAITLLSILLPARRAAHIEPSRVLRLE